MTINDALLMVDEIKPNAFTNAQKVFWLNSLEQTLCTEVFLMDPKELPKHRLSTDDLDQPMMLMPPYDDLYIMWLEAKIDEANGEYTKYMNTMQIFNTRRDEFIAWFCNRYDPAQKTFYIKQGAEEIW